MDGRVERTIENLKKNGFTVKYFEDAARAKEAILAEVEADASAGFGGSVTVDGMGIYEALKEKGHPVFCHWKVGPGEDRKAILREAATTDVYFTSSNAITEAGALVNIDGTGNRLSSMLYGHKRLFVVAGVNKIAGSYEEAIIRIKNQTCGPNARRLGLKTPCAELDKCMNCSSPQRICKATLIIDRQPNAVPVTIYLINEKLGY